MRLKSIFWLLVWTSVLGFFFLLSTLHSYQVFTREEMVAVVECFSAPQGSPQPYVLRVTPVSQKVLGQPRDFPLFGEQWAIGGDILKWHPWLNYVGLKTCHRLTRLNGRYWKAEDENLRPRSAYDLNGGTDDVWKLLYRVGQWVPGVEAVYGNSSYAPMVPGNRWGVYVTLSGYLLKPYLTASTSK